LAVLYVVNIFQPIAIDEIFEESKNVLGNAQLKKEVIDSTLRALMSRDLLLADSSKRYSCTAKGLHTVANLGLWKVRDKNRMLILAKRLKER
jgi:hypothetical protein